MHSFKISVAVSDFMHGVKDDITTVMTLITVFFGNDSLKIYFIDFLH